MKLVNVYTYSTARSPKASKCEAVGYVLEYPTKTELVTLQKMRNRTEYD